MEAELETGLGLAGASADLAAFPTRRCMRRSREEGGRDQPYGRERTL